MNTYPFIIIITVFLVALWAYASLSKILNLAEFKQAMALQVFPDWFGKMLIILVPLAELILIGLLLVPASRLLGMYGSFFMMSAFTMYIAGALLHLYERTPCACGGLFARLGWRAHLRLNIVLTLISLAGIMLLSE